MQGRISEKVAIITGAADGIGRATAKLFAKEGAKIVIADIHEEKLKEVADEIEKEKGAVCYRKTDVSQEGEIKDLVKLALDTYSQIDILCNNAGTGGDGASIDQQNGETWQRVYAVNVLGAVYAVKAVSPHMMERKQGSIVNTSSVAGIRSGAGGNAYSASKAALINFTMTAACDLGGFNVRVNAVCPGLIKTGMTKRAFERAKELNKMDKIGYRCELRRYGRPEEIASTILFLASDEASYITGQALAVDGGNTASLNLPGMKF
jgi:NAD(P)-dependent dehydrogenase (short-subunit alcohol dehydrogenase family)